ncbi:histidinol-phosphate transaminase [soil metagenome]
MSGMYEKLETPPAGLRLHLNENTGGCSPAVLEALRTITPEAAALYPDYTAPTAAAAERLGLPASHVLLVNGLDEGIFASALTTLRGGAQHDPFEAIVIVPGFDMFPGSSRRVGGRVVPVPLGPDFVLSFDAVQAAVSTRTRIIFITNPHNPTGLTVPRHRVLSVARDTPGALIFVDEAYIDFGGDSLADQATLDAHPNLVVGRTFSKAYGLAALRLGALLATPATLATLRDSVPPYSINIAAAVALSAACRDTAHYEWYLAEVLASKELLYDALDRLGVHYWRSAANFVLVRLPGRAAAVADALRARGIYVRDRSADPACAGCVRITTGVVAHTQACITALEEVLCDAR